MPIRLGEIHFARTNAPHLPISSFRLINKTTKSPFLTRAAIPTNPAPLMRQELLKAILDGYYHPGMQEQQELSRQP